MRPRVWFMCSHVRPHSLGNLSRIRFLQQIGSHNEPQIVEKAARPMFFVAKSTMCGKCTRMLRSLSQRNLPVYEQGDKVVARKGKGGYLSGLPVSDLTKGHPR